MFEQDMEKILVTTEEIQKRVQEIGAQITKEYQGKEVTLICLLNGAITFMADLGRAIDLIVCYDFMKVSSYGNSTVSSGNVRIAKDLANEIFSKHVIIVEDIVDTGTTLERIVNFLQERNPASLKVCCLLDKAERRKIEIPVDYCGFVIPDEFAVGYGLDYDEKYRNLPYIGVLKEEIYKEN